MPLNAECAIDGVDGEEAICGGLITKVTAKKGSAGQNLSGRARAIFTLAVNLRGFPPGVPTGVGKNLCVFSKSLKFGHASRGFLRFVIHTILPNRTQRTVKRAESRRGDAHN